MFGILRILCPVLMVLCPELPTLSPFPESNRRNIKFKTTNEISTPILLFKEEL